jgi:hypothetical protein
MEENSSTNEGTMGGQSLKRNKATNFYFEMDDAISQKNN